LDRKVFFNGSASITIGQGVPMSEVRGLTACALTALVMSGCAGTIPDLKPYADTTASLRSSVSQSFRATSQSLLTSAEVAPLVGSPKAKGQAEELRGLATRYDEEASHRVAALTALVDYSDRLAAIAASGRTEQERVRQTSEALSTLVTTVGSALAHLPAAAGGTAVVAQLVKLTGEAAAHAEAVRVTATLDRAVDAATPGVKLLVAALAADLSLLRAEIATHASVVADFQRQLPLLKYEAFLREKVLPLGDELPAKEQELEVVARSLARVERWAAADRGRFAEARQRMGTSTALIIASKEAVENWARAHEDIGAAIRASRQPNIAALTETVKEIKTLIDEIRKLTAK
jgi:hypothetical protein